MHCNCIHCSHIASIPLQNECCKASSYTREGCQPCRGFWEKGLRSAWVNKEGVTPSIIDAYRRPQLIRGWEAGMLEFLAARTRCEIPYNSPPVESVLMLHVAQACSLSSQEIVHSLFTFNWQSFSFQFLACPYGCLLRAPGHWILLLLTLQLVSGRCINGS